MVTRNLQTGPQNLPKSTPKSTKKSKNRAPTPPKWSQEGARMAQKSKNNIDPTKKRGGRHSVPPFWRKMWPTWPQLGSQDGAKIRLKTSKMGYPIGLGGEKIERKHQRKKEEGSVSQGPPPCAKKWPTWPQLGSRVAAKMAQKAMQKCIIFLMPLRIDF